MDDDTATLRDEDIETTFTGASSQATADADGTDGDAADAADGDAADGDAADVSDGDAGDVTDADQQDA